MTAPIVLVVARAENGVIGAGGVLPWRLSDDLKRFKQLTMGKPCIMGRKTWESLPKRPLPGRTNIVVTRNPGFSAEGALLAASFDTAVARADEEHPSQIMVIGGAELFAMALPRASRIELTEIHASPHGDVFLPAFAPAEWRETAREDREAEGLRWSYVRLDRH